MKKFLFSLIVFSLFLGVTAIGQCAEPVSFENGDFTIDGITVNDNIKDIIAKKGQPSVSQTPDKNSAVYQYAGRYTLLADGDGNVWYIATTSLATARNVKPGMSKQQMMDAYGDKYEYSERDKRFNYEYLGETTKLVFSTNSSGVILQIDCIKYK